MMIVAWTLLYFGLIAFLVGGLIFLKSKMESSVEAFGIGIGTSGIIMLLVSAIWALALTIK